jgi:hypothetical protein
MEISSKNTNLYDFLAIEIVKINWLAIRCADIILRAMKTLKRIPVGVINISSTPHNTDGSTYIELFLAAFALKQRIKIKADQYAYIASCGRLNENDDLSCLTGEIHKFTEISGDWENLQKFKAASPEDISAINIPDHLKPNRESFRFFLFPKEHRLTFQMLGIKRRISAAPPRLPRRVYLDGSLRLIFAFRFHCSISAFCFPNFSFCLCRPPTSVF